MSTLGHRVRFSLAARIVLMVLGLAVAECQVVAQRRPDTVGAPRRSPAVGHKSMMDDPGQYHFELAQVHQRYGKFDEAQQCYTRGIEVAKSPQLKVRILSAWGHWLAKTKKPDEARAKFEQALAVAENERTKCQIALSLARALEQAGKIDEAAKHYEYVASHAETPWLRESAQNQLFSAYRKAGKLDEMVKRYQDALAADPKDEAAMRALLAIHSRIKPDTGKALAVCEQLSALKPDDAAVLTKLADLHLRARQTDKAIAIYEKLAEQQPAQKSRYYERISHAYLTTKDKEKAVQWAEKIVQSDSKSAHAWSRFAEVCLRADQPQKAVAAFQQAVSVARSDSQREMYQLSLGDAYRKANRDQDAIAIYEKLGKESKSPHIRRRVKRQLFDLYEQKGMLDKVKFERGGGEGKAADKGKPNN